MTENDIEREKIEHFKDLILNKDYCDDCNNLCSMAETFPLKFVANYIIKLEKEFKNSISKDKIKEKIEKCKEKCTVINSFKIEVLEELLESEE